jgi:hypothetical protein
MRGRIPPLEQLPMVSHKFAVGDRVRLTLDRYAESSPWDIHTISRKLPAEANVCQYRVKRVGDGQERTVSEPQMVAVKAEGRTADSHFKTIEAQQDTQRERSADARSRGPAGRSDRGRR